MSTTTERIIYARPRCMEDCPTHYCAGCGHGIAHRLIAEIIDEMDIRERTIGVAPVGCGVIAYNYINIDWTEAAHGRPPAVATGIKRMLPDRIVFTYQGDGDLASIGMAEIIHAASRGENITVVFLNNAVYGMTQGQMAPTSLIGQKTTTSPRGRDAETMGYPIRMCELLGSLEGARFLVRTALSNPQRVREAKRAIRKAFQNQVDGVGFSMVEVLSPCPTYWRLEPSRCGEFIETTMSRTFPLGVVKDTQAGAAQ
jgi:2-oxoglutarate ferredoxin oxidoreductase subunit beta